MSKRVISRRDFAATAATGLAGLAVACGAPAPPPPNAGQAGAAPPDASDDSKIAPLDSQFDVVFVGAFGFHRSGDAIDAYSIPQHDPLLIVHVDSEVEVASGSLSTVEAKVLRDLHPYFRKEGKDAKYKVMCLGGWRVQTASGLATWGADVDWPDMRSIADVANNKEFKFETNVKPVATLGKGSFNVAPPTEAPGRKKEWTFIEGSTAYGPERRLTDVSRFRRNESYESFTVESYGAGGSLKITPKSGTPAWVVALPIQVDEQTQSQRKPHILEHGKHYFDFLSTDSTPTIRPIAQTKKFDVDEKDPIQIECPTTAGVRLQRMSPPDTEFCYQARL